MNKTLGSLLPYTAVKFLVVYAVLFLDGFVLSLLWVWFIVPVFELSAITIPVATGLVLMMKFVTGTNSSSYLPEYDPDDDPSFLEVLGRNTFFWVFRSLFVLGGGLLVKSFM